MRIHCNPKRRSRNDRSKHRARTLPGLQEDVLPEATVQGHHYRTKHIVDWFEQQGIDNLNELSGRDLHEFRLWHMDRGNINQVTLRQHMCTLRVFLKWAASIDAVDPELYDKVMVPKITREERKRYPMLEVEDAKEILNHLTKYPFAVSWQYDSPSTTPPAIADDYLFAGRESSSIYVLGPGPSEILLLCQKLRADYRG